MRTLRAIGLAAAMVVTGAAAHAQARVFVGIGGPSPIYAAGYAPPCPGPGYFWVDGYNNGGYYVPGRWEFRRDRDARFYNRDRFYDRDRFVNRPEYEHEMWHGGYAHFDGDRHNDRDRHEDRERHDREGYRR